MSLTREAIFRQVAQKQITIEEAKTLLARLQEPSSPPAGDVTFPLSEGQKALWVITRTAPANYAYNVPVAFRVSPGLDVPALRRALKRVVDRHPGLRTVIEAVQGEPVQRVKAQQQPDFYEVELPARSEAEVRDLVKAEARRPFVLSEGPLLRTVLFRRPAPDDSILLLTVHHIVYDGISVQILLQDLQRFYREELSGRRPATVAPAGSYEGFVAWQKAMLSGPEGSRLKQYWQRQLEGWEPLDLPFDRQRPPVPRYEGRSLPSSLPAALTATLHAIAARRNQTLFALLLAAYQVLLSRYSRQEDFVVATPMAGRPDTAFEDSIGYYVNMVPIRCRVSGDQPFEVLLDQVYDTVLGAMEHSHYPSFLLARESGGSPGGLFQATFHYQSWIRDLFDEASREGFLGEILGEIHQEGEFDLALEVYQRPEGCDLVFKYNPDLFDEATVSRMASQYTTLLHSIAEQPGGAVAQLPLMTRQAQHQILVGWNQTEAAYPRQCVHELFAEQARRTPDAIAVLCEGRQLRYRELREQASRLARCLSQSGVGRGSVVGVFMEPCVDMLVGLLAIMEAGGTYVPLDPNTPADRLSFMCEDTAMQVLLTQTFMEERLAGHPVRKIRMDRDDALIAEQAGAFERAGLQLVPPSLDDLAYIIYTSGSTGKPKGVQVPHRGLTNVIWSMAQAPGCTADDHVLALTTISFDIAAVELYMPLIVGGRVELLPVGYTNNGVKLRQKIEATEATIVQATPATWQMLIAAEWTAKKPFRAITAGEALNPSLAEKLLARVDQLWNQYGPTENSIYTTIDRVWPGQKVTIGRPIHNNTLYILDSRMNPVPAGVPGELYIGGVGLAAGYLHRPEVTAAAFVSSPFHPGERLYRTGDLVRYLPDGRVDYLGRIDHQVKIRGFRIELGEIEAALLKDGRYKEAVAVVREEVSGQKRLVAFLIPAEPGGAVHVAEQKEVLRKWLPEYMVPSTFIVLASLPLTLSQKVDRKVLSTRSLPALLEQFGGASEAPPAAPPAGRPASGAMQDALRHLLDEDIARTVAEVLNLPVSQIDRHTNFGEYGYDSISFTTLSVRLQHLYGLEITPALFYEYATVDRLTAYLAQTHGAGLATHYGNLPASAPAAAAAGPAAQAVTPPPCRSTNAPVAIVGMGGVLPQSPDLQTFWEHLKQGLNMVSEVPADRWDWRDVYGDPAGDALKTNSKWGGFLHDVDKFDATFFGISPREAELMDPQQRLLLEVVWKTMEDAGYRPSDFQGSNTGVFLGVTANDYADLVRESGRGIEPHTMSGVSRTLVANRISYRFDLHGPSVVIDTACSSSLVAVHQAVLSLQSGQCDAAIVGGVNLLLSPIPFVALSKNGMLSPNGTCKTFDRSADGYVRGEGAITLLLKPLHQAEADGDHIYAVIRGSAENHGGRTNSLTAPNPNAQADLVVAAFGRAGFDPASVTYIEAHGTGTRLGDPIEVNALKRAFRTLFERSGAAAPAAPYCGLGSVKTNIGHLEAAAGIAGLLKVVLAMKNRTLPASLHLQELNPYIDLQSTPFYVVKQTRPWDRLTDRFGTPVPRRAGVSSFGFGGENAHVLLEEYEPAPARPRSGAERSLFVLSARTESQLRLYAGQLASFLNRQEGTSPYGPDVVAATLQLGREPMEARLALTVSDLREAADMLQAYAEGRAGREVVTGAARRPAPAAAGAPPADEQVQRALRSRDWAALARLWADGADVDWRVLYENGPVGRVPLPTYPFERQRHWVTDAPVGSFFRKVQRPGVLHPLLDANVSTFAEQCYERTLTPADYVLRDHVLNQEMILPGAAYLEMACAAARLASPASGQGGGVRTLKNVMWAQPVTLRGPELRLLVSLRPEGADAEFEVRSERNGAASVHARGTVSLAAEEGRLPAPERFDLEQIRSRCTAAMDGSDCYALLAARGFAYGQNFRTVQNLVGNGTEALATLELPPERAADFDSYLLHPSLVDGALQTVLGLVGLTDPESPVLYLPIAVGEVNLHAPLSRRCLAYATYAGRTTGSKIRKFTIWIVDDAGNVLVQIKDFTTRAYVEPKAIRTVAQLLSYLEQGLLSAEEVDQLLEGMHP
jgi:amino acid adenylation domain-containing protein